jgi:hypothetical protein
MAYPLGFNVGRCCHTAGAAVIKVTLYFHPLPQALAATLARGGQDALPHPRINRALANAQLAAQPADVNVGWDGHKIFPHSASICVYSRWLAIEYGRKILREKEVIYRTPQISDSKSAPTAD